MSEPAGTAGTKRGSGREAITAAARAVFAERGYHGASIRDIAARAGLSLSALYYWYAGKEELLFALLVESRSDYLDTCRRAVAAAGDDPTARLTALVEATVHYRVRRRVESQISALEWRHLDPEHVAELDRFRVEAGRLWSDAVQAGVRTGAFACTHPAEARRVVQSSCNAIPTWYDPTGPMDVDELAARFVTIALRVVDHRPAGG